MLILILQKFTSENSNSNNNLILHSSTFPYIPNEREIPDQIHVNRFDFFLHRLQIPTSSYTQNH